MARLDKVLAGTQITDEYTYRTGSTALGLLHDAFLASTVVVRTAAGGGGTLLELTTDYTLSAEDTRLTTEAGATVYTKLAVVNGTYQNTPLYVSYKCVTDYNRASDINNRGRKIGLEAYYVSSDLIRIRPGSVEVNDVMVTKTTATDFTTGATNFPGAGSWVYICSDIAGALSLEAATGAGSVRPSDACFQLTGSSVGYDDIGKFGYYFNPGKRIIAAAHRVSATSWYFINMLNGSDEIGENSYGSWSYIGRKLRQWGFGQSQSVALTSAWFSGYKGTGTIIFPRQFPSATRYRFHAMPEYTGANKDLFIGSLNYSTYHLADKIDFRVLGNPTSETLTLLFDWSAEEV